MQWRLPALLSLPSTELMLRSHCAQTLRESGLTLPEQCDSLRSAVVCTPVVD
jgi:hypothetical protein